MTPNPDTLFTQAKTNESRVLEGVLSEPNTPRRVNNRVAIDQTKFEAAVRFALNRPQISTHAPVASALLEYLAHTVPHFNKSEFCALAIETALQIKHPELWAVFFGHAMIEPKWKQTVLRNLKR